ncbi:hypothetical protein COCSUDRAFT_65972 [Coccomyxa subellipsoidea C-169]|uniref:Uncharacterized protein n=1 Tax=Coccomyxa subellipsoidea (strain C-169) TaxID=574566 RepID=I0YYS8_COCSC|nr:hypothetical protein COCSUDRAFT_65972 [Coccomyxa subellipsoidea C-169]EIE23547.1 hypothetical protein COCSUDRAFT_65972 [Coccomyxa subellipsoidea C-169]|eukprot:XP_005648091.1 hypothetical protein COCSUDRAFT_65972 [Coccomyxa subellipsoidea C-169]
MNTAHRSMHGCLSTSSQFLNNFGRTKCFSNAVFSGKCSTAAFEPRRRVNGVLQRSGLVRASGESPDASPASSMSIDEAYDLLGVKEEAGFDEIMSAKNRLTSASQGDKDKIVQGLVDPAGRVSNDAPGLQIALALGASVYLLTDKKRVGRGRAVGITVAGLLLGVLIGGGLQSWLRVDIVPIGGLASPAAFVSEFGILALWASVSLLA